jgi:uncharacterized HhH-GPD family protein
MLLDQQVPMEWAFSGPYTLQQRLGGLDAARIAAMDPDEFLAVCKGPPAVHRFPGSMGKRVQALAQAIVDDYDGNAEAIWRDVETGDELHHRLIGLPGYGEEKTRIFIALLAKRFDVRPKGWEEAAGPFGGRPQAGRKPIDVDRVNTQPPSATRCGGCGRPDSHGSHPRGEDIRGIRGGGGDHDGDGAGHAVVMYDS